MERANLLERLNKAIHESEPIDLSFNKSTADRLSGAFGMKILVKTLNSDTYALIPVEALASSGLRVIESVPGLSGAVVAGSHSARKNAESRVSKLSGATAMIESFDSEKRRLMFKLERNAGPKKT